MGDSCFMSYGTTFDTSQKLDGDTFANKQVHLAESSVFVPDPHEFTKIGAIAFTGANLKQRWLPYQYDLAVRGLNNLRFTQADDILPFKESAELFTRTKSDWLANRYTSGDIDDFFIAPNTQYFGMDRISRYFDVREFKDNAYGSRWTKFDELDPAVHDNHHLEKWIVGISLNDRRANTIGEPGLRSTNIRADQLRTRFKEEQDKGAKEGIILEPITLPQILVINAIRNLAQRPLLDQNGTVTRLIHYDSQLGFIPEAYYAGKRQIVNYSRVNNTWAQIGGRRVLILSGQTNN